MSSISSFANFVRGFASRPKRRPSDYEVPDLSAARAESFADRYNAQRQAVAPSAIQEVSRQDADADTIRPVATPSPREVPGLGIGAGVAPQVPVSAQPIMPVGNLPLDLTGGMNQRREVGDWKGVPYMTPRQQAKQTMQAGVQRAEDEYKKQYSSDRQQTQWNKKDTDAMRGRMDTVDAVQRGEKRMYVNPLIAAPDVGIDTGGKPMAQPARYDWTDTTNVEGNPVGRPLSQATVDAARRAAGLDTAAGKSPMTREQADAAAAADPVRQAYAKRQADKATADRMRANTVMSIPDALLRKQAITAAQNAQLGGTDQNAAIKPMALGFSTAEDMQRFDEAQAMRRAMQQSELETAKQASVGRLSEEKRAQFDAYIQIINALTKQYESTFDPAAQASLSARISETVTKLNNLTGAAAAPSAQTTGATVPQAAINYLKQHPEFAQKFDAKYGRGASAQYLRK
jgi:ribosomal protein L13E